MVRINLINPKALADQHLIAEYNEILMLLGHIKKYPIIRNQPKEYCLGAGHINFFKDKIIYLKKRHEILKKEMKKRGFKPTKTIKLTQLKKSLKKDWKPKRKDKEIIKKRLIEKIKLKPTFYKYNGGKTNYKILIKKIKDE